MKGNRSSPAQTRLGFRVQRELADKLRRFARQRGLRPSTVIRTALIQYLEQHERVETAYDVAARTGFIGTNRGAGLPSTLSTNPKYMEGFGRARRPLP